MSLPWKLAPAVPSVGTSTARASMPGLAGLVERLADRGDLGVGEGDAGRADAFGDRLDLAAEQVLGRDPGLVLAHVGEEGAAVDVADRVEPLAAADPQPVVGLEEAVLVGLDADRLEAELGGVGDAADGDQDLGGLDRAAVARARRSTPAPPASTCSAWAPVRTSTPKLLAQRRRRPPRRRRAPRARAGARRPRPGSPWCRATPRPGRARCRPGRRRARSCSPGPAWRWSPRGCSRLGPCRGRRSAASRRRCRWRRPPPCARSGPRRRRRPAARRRSGPRRGRGRCPVLPARAAGPESSRSWITSSRRSRIACGSSSPSPTGDAGHPPRLGQHVGGAQQRLRGHAGVVGAFAADQVLLDDRDLQAAVGEAAGADLARGPGAEHDRVVLLLAHGSHRTYPDTVQFEAHIARGRQASTWSTRAKGCRSRLPEASLNPGTNQYVRTMSSPSPLS